MTDADAQIRLVAVEALGAASLLLPSAEFTAVHAAVARHGMAAWRRLCREERSHRNAPRALGLAPSEVTRVLGFGHVQADALARALRVDDSRGVPVAGALLNLGVSLFDWIADRHPERMPAVSAAVAPPSLDRLAAGSPLGRHGEPGTDLLFAVVESFFAATRAIAATGAVADELLAVLHQMLEAHLAATAASRTKTAPGPAVWRAVEAKSVLPMRAMALLSVLGDSRPALRPARALGTAIGHVLWRVDDLIDAGEDWDAGAWSRPWLLHADRCRRGLLPTASREQALACLMADGVPSVEATDLAEHMHEVRRIATPVDACVRATVHSWIAV